MNVASYEVLSVFLGSKTFWSAIFPHMTQIQKGIDRAIDYRPSSVFLHCVVETLRFFSAAHRDLAEA